MKVMPPVNMQTSLATTLALILLLCLSGSTTGCKLDVSSSVPMNGPIFDGRLGPYNIRQTVTLTCSGGDCGAPSWWGAQGQLLEDGPSLTLTLGPCDEGRKLHCKNNNANITVTLDLLEDVDRPCVTSTPPTTTTSTAIKTRARPTIAIKTPSMETTSPTSLPLNRTDNSSQNTTKISTQTTTKISTQKNTNISSQSTRNTSNGGKQTTTVSVRQGVPESDTDESDKDQLTIYLIVSGVLVVGGLALASLITTICLYKKVGKVGNIGSPSHPQPPSAIEQQSSAESSIVENTPETTLSLTSLDPNDLPPISPLVTSKPPGVGGAYDPLLTRGEAAVAADNRDHSYYYPEQPCSYHYPDITPEVKQQILRDFV